MTTHTEDKKLAELSAAIDAVNRGERPDGSDKEIRELAEVAAVLKRTGPPPAIVNALAQTLSGELAAKQKRRRLWLTSGAAGTAAAAMLVVALNLNPSTPAPPPMVIPPAGSVVIESIPAKPPVDVAKTETPSAPKEQPVKEEAPPVRDQVAATNGEKRTMLAKEEKAAQPAEAADEKAVAAQKAPTVAFLAWPGRQPDTETTDKNGASVRQVYGSGGDGEVIITQRVTSRVAMAPAGEARMSTLADSDASAGKKAGGKVNRVTATVKGYVVTVEGSQSEEELWKIAQSLE